MQKNKLVRSMGTPTISKSILKLSTLTLSMMCLSLAHAEETNEEESVKPTKKVAKSDCHWLINQRGFSPKFFTHYGH